jgi:hypothetical protein
VSVRLWDGVTWEGYRKCAASEIPGETRWDRSRFSSNTHDVFFGGPPRSEPYEWGAPLRKVIRRSNDAVEFARYHRTRKTPKENADD